MFCKKCGIEMKENSKFCPRCGAYQQQTNSVQVTENIPAISKEILQRPRKKRKFGVLFLVLLILLLVSGGIGMGFFMKKKLKKSVPTSSDWGIEREAGEAEDREDSSVSEYTLAREEDTSSDTLANIESEETTLEPLEGTEWSAIPSETSPAVPIWAGNQTAAEQGELLLPTEDPQGVILPESSIRLLTEIDLNDLTKEELRLARNEIYARHGRKFNDSTLQSYFDSKIWYRGSISPDQFDDMALLSNLERKNLDIIKEKEASMN
jgi:hypothetical protein